MSDEELPEVHILMYGATLCQREYWPSVVHRNRVAKWVHPGEPDPDVRDEVTCGGCLVRAGDLLPYERGWPPVQLGPYGTPCDFCGRYGDESTQDPLSGDGQGCFDCVGNWLDSLKEETAAAVEQWRRDHE